MKETGTLTFTFAAEDRISISFSMLLRLRKMSKMMTCRVLMIDRDGNAIDAKGSWANRPF